MTDDLLREVSDPSMAVVFIPGEVRARTNEEHQPLNAGNTIVCPGCNHTYKPVSIGMYVLETIDYQRDFRPYRIWSADLLACDCGHTLMRMASKPLHGEWDSTFVTDVYNIYMAWQNNHDFVAFWTEGRGYRDDLEIAKSVHDWLTGANGLNEDLLVYAEQSAQQPDYSQS